MEQRTGKYNESELTLKYAEKVKSELEKLGLKVGMTRDGTEDEENLVIANLKKCYHSISTKMV